MEQIGKFAIVGQIGTGGFGVVFEGRDPFLKRRVAIKTCTSEEPEIRDRFFREAEIAGNLQHRNVVTVHDFGVQDGIPFLVQEYLSGEDLDRIVGRREPLPAVRRVEILLEAAQGLEYAHSRGVIHRDIKPANIRLTAEGHVKIMDFGIAKLSNVASHLTRTGMTLGTAAYLPPEQIRGTPVDHRADMFSFGVTAYELLTFHRPFGGKTISSLFWEILQKDPEPLTTHWATCPPALNALVLRCLAKDPAGRYAGFGELIPALESILEDLRQAGESETRRGEDKTAPFAAIPGSDPAARLFAAHDPGLPQPSPAAKQARKRVGGQQLAAAASAVGKLEAPKSGENLLGEVEEALAGARVAGATRRARELLAAGNLEGAERELSGLPTDAAPVVAARRALARARADRQLAQAAALWQQGQPQAAIDMLEQLLARVPDHQDARRLRESWQAEVDLRERQRAAVAAEADGRRQAVGQAVARAEELLSRGDLDGAESVIAAATADLGSQQPLRDLRRKLVEARQGGAQGATVASRALLDASTVGVAASKVEEARRRALAAQRTAASGVPAGLAPPPRGGSEPSLASPSWSIPGAAPPPPLAWSPANVASAEPPGAAASPLRTTLDNLAARTPVLRVLLIVAAALALLLVVALLARQLLSRQPAAAPPVPMPSAAPAASTPGQVAIGVPPAPSAPALTRPARALDQVTPAYPRGLAPAPASVTLGVLVDADGNPTDITLAGAGAVDPRLFAAAKRAAQATRFEPALQGGVPVRQRISLTYNFTPPKPR